MSEKSAPADGIEGTTEDLTGELKETLGSVGVDGDGEHDDLSRPRSAHSAEDTKSKGQEPS